MEIVMKLDFSPEDVVEDGDFVKVGHLPRTLRRAQATHGLRDDRAGRALLR